MEKWSVTLTGGVQPGAEPESAWARLAQQIGQAPAAFELGIRQRLPVTLAATDPSRARSQLQKFEACGVEVVLLSDDGLRLWVRPDKVTCGPVSGTFARRALQNADWNDAMQACRVGETQWQPLRTLVRDEAERTAPGQVQSSHEPTSSLAASAAPTADQTARDASAATPGNGSVQAADLTKIPLPGHVAAPGLHAGFWMRVAAYLLDYLVLLAVMFTVGLLVAAMKSVGESSEVSVAGWQVLNLGITWLYFAAFESSSWQATPGKRALGMRVVDLHGAPIGFGRATGRFLGKIPSGLILCIGYMMAGWTTRKQALHDMMAGCCVVRQGGLDALAEDRLSAYRATMPTWAVVLVVFGALGLFVVPVLAAIAIPAYQDYVVRAQVSAGIAESDDVRSAVDRYLHRQGRLPESNTSLRMDTPADRYGKFLTDVTVDQGNVVLTFGGAQINPRLRDRHLTFFAQVQGRSVSWTCSSSDIPQKFLPPLCRQ